MKARFHLPDFAGHCLFNLLFVEYFKKNPAYFREGVEIASVYGAFPQSIWNGGRTQNGFFKDKMTIRLITHAFNERGIPLRFTFTNPVLEEEHLSDEFCNSVMQIADNGMNEVIVTSPLLEEYIRKTYPNYKITSSTCKRITDKETLMQEFEKDYHAIVIDYDFNHEFDILEGLPDKKKCELLVNACCNPGCPTRSEHYRLLGIQQIAYATHINKYQGSVPFDAEKLEKEYPGINKICPYMERSLFEVMKLKNHISPDEIWEKYIPMGFEQFKIEGRTFGTLNLIEHYMYYMVKPECRDQARYEFESWLMNNEVMHVKEFALPHFRPKK